jgi:hypothetical protein
MSLTLAQANGIISVSRLDEIVACHEAPREQEVDSAWNSARLT